MDPKNIPPNLDPKLREVYERVMRTPVGPAQPPPPAPAPSPGPAPFPAALTPTQTPSPPEHAVASQGTQAVFTPVNPSTNATPSLQNRPPMLTVLFVVVGVIFFAAYALFWIRFFNLPVPFLPK